MKAKNVVHGSIRGAAAITASSDGAAVDVSELIGSMVVTLDSSAGGGANHTLNVKLQESADGVNNWTDITGGAFTEVTNAAASFQSIIISADARKKYIRGVDTVAGTDPAFSRALSYIGHKQYS